MASSDPSNQETRTVDSPRSESQALPSIVPDENLQAYIDVKFDAQLKSIKTEIESTKRSILYDLEKKFEKLEVTLTLKFSTSEKDVDTSAIETNPNLPAKTLEDFLHFDEVLKTQAQTRQALMRLMENKLCGQQSIQGCIKEILPLILTKNVQLLYSGAGKTIRNVSKLNFSETQIYSCLEHTYSIMPILLFLFMV